MTTKRCVIGVEYHYNDVGSIEIDSLTLNPYVASERENLKHDEGALRFALARSLRVPLRTEEAPARRPSARVELKKLIHLGGNVESGMMYLAQRIDMLEKENS